MKIDINAFTGMRPAVADRLLTDNEATSVYNADLENGDIIPIKRPSYLSRTAYTVQSLFQHDLSYLNMGQPIRTYAGNRSFVPSPIANDDYGRVYMSDDDNGGLYFIDKNNNEYKLGVQYPTVTPNIAAIALRSGAISVSTTGDTFRFSDTANRGNRPYLYPDETVTFSGTTLPGGISADTEYKILQAKHSQENGLDVYDYSIYLADDTDKEQIDITSAGSGVICTAASENETQNRAYLFTMVDVYGQESAPSLPVSMVCDASSKVTLSGMSSPSAVAGYPAFQYKRIYRTATGDSGTTSYMFVDEIPATSTTYSDCLLDEELGEILPSQDWELPPSDLKHLCGMAGGIMVAHTSSEVMFSDVYYPYAYPDANRYTLEGNIKTIAVSHNTVFVLTDSVVHVLTVQSDGSSVYISKLDGYTPCLSVKAVVTSPNGVLFPSNDGLYLVQEGASSATNVTEQLISEKEWMEYVTSAFIATYYDSVYLAFFKKEDNTQGTMLIDFGNSQQARMRYMDDYGTALNIVPNGRRIFYAAPTGSGGGSSIYELYALPNNGYLFANWRSKDFLFPTPINFGSLIVETMSINDEQEKESDINFWGGTLGTNLVGEVPFAGESSNLYPINIENYISITVVADDTIRYSGVISPNKFIRLPKGYVARKWSIYISTSLPISRIALGTSIEELR